MHVIYHDPTAAKRQQWQRIWPTALLALTATGQMLLTFAIIAMETWSLVVNIEYAFFFVGYITGFFFTLTWISTFCVVCCNRGSQGCATHGLVENILSAIAASVLLYYDVRFVRDPFTCLWPGITCGNYSWWDINYSNQDLKLIIVKVQLSCAAIMLALNVLYILIYTYTSLKVNTRSSTIMAQHPIELQQRQVPPPVPSWSAQPPVWPPPSNF